jgi:hypothetical protein
MTKGGAGGMGTGVGAYIGYTKTTIVTIVAGINPVA